MIAQPNRHYDQDTLRQLLDEALPRDQVATVESHLSVCETCRGELEQLAGQRHWWDETVNILTESTITAKENSARVSHHSRPLDASLEWIRPLLEHSQKAGSDAMRDHSIGRVDQYEVQDVIGQGGMGVVLRGIDPELNRPVAIKVLSPHLAGVGASRARFMREAQAAAAIVHPSIVPIYSVVPSARLPYLVMPCIDGGNLQQRIDREGPLEIAEIIRIGLQIAEGLVAAHHQGVIHRDIKPANILIEEGNGRVLISDFGLARALDDASLTMSGMIAGTPQFMSPEQARGEVIDARSDLYSLGSLLYTLATGRPPFRAETPLAVLRKISETTPRPIHVINEQMPPWLDRLVGFLMQNEVSKRIGTAEDAVCLLRDTHAHVRNPAANPLPSELLCSPLKRRSLKWCVTLVACAIMLGGLVWRFRPQNEASPARVGRRIQSPLPTQIGEAASGQSGRGFAPYAANDLNTPSQSLAANPAYDSQSELAWSDSSTELELQSIDWQLTQLAIELESFSPPDFVSNSITLPSSRTSETLSTPMAPRNKPDQGVQVDDTSK